MNILQVRPNKCIFDSWGTLPLKLCEEGAKNGCTLPLLSLGPWRGCSGGHCAPTWGWDCCLVAAKVQRRRGRHEPAPWWWWSWSWRTCPLLLSLQSHTHWKCKKAISLGATISIHDIGCDIQLQMSQLNAGCIQVYLWPAVIAIGEGPLGGRGSSHVLISTSTLSKNCTKEK